MKNALVSLATIALIGTSSAPAAFLVFPTDDNHVVSFAPGVTPGNNNAMQVMNRGDSEIIFLKFTLPSFVAGTANNAILEIVKSHDDGNTLNTPIKLRTADNLLNDNATPWTENNINWNNMPALGASDVDTNANPGDLTGSLRSAANSHKFSSAGLDAVINSAGPGATVSFSVYFSNSSPVVSAEEAYYETEFADSNFWPSLNFDAQEVPEPAFGLLAMLGGLMVALRRHRDRH